MNTYNTTLQTNNTSLSSILNTINALPDAGGAELPELTNPAAASEIGLNKEAIDAEGNKITGTFTLDTEIDSQEDLISQIAAALDGKAAGGSGGSSLETCEFTLTFTGNGAGYASSDGGNVKVYYSKVNNGACEPIELLINSDTTTITDVLKGSHLLLWTFDNITNMLGCVETMENVSLEYSFNGSSSSSIRLLFIGESGSYTIS